MGKEKEKRKDKETKKETRKNWKIGTWNIKSIQGKENELEEEFEELGLDILVITETKKKGQGITKLHNNNILIFSGVKLNERAAARVGCIIYKELEEEIEEWQAWSERILTVAIKNKKKNILKTIIIVYGPNENDTKDIKDKFWEKLSLATEGSRGELYIAGDFNSRVGKKDKTYNTVIGDYGENTRNNNGKRMLDFCIFHNLIITNTFFERKNIHKYTREVKSRDEKSIIDFILIERANRKMVLDTRVRRGPEIGSDHFLVVSKNIQKSKKIK
ncbi:unnamed protein product [Brassicogethes aeneus]|uniref:Endonuclease/exonuclease/phosphatase domain-containing protein n=1 Tax=Brassicogethes aeneus TaxID=1431903 RepID=A0A9P0BA08_BRAAE|nr:unnamed protein product [Brassicogethes aeneus]